ncbi:MAG: ATP-binding protein [Culicoidibacterales bacterium]
MKKNFDLNMQKVLENWDVSLAIREIIANALDEQNITKTADIEIFCDDLGNWHIKDYGRGLNYIHLTQNENEEKLNHPNLIGRFGFGLKDALATLYRNNVELIIKSKNSKITLENTKKIGFEDIETLHACIESYNNDFIGTEFILKGCTSSDIYRAKKNFLKFEGITPIEVTEFGEIYLKKDDVSSIYINGIKVATEENFMFSYNITSLNAAIKKSLNRERLNVGRSAYKDRIEKILLQASNPVVMERIAKELENQGSTAVKDEVRWSNVAMHAIKVLNTAKNYAFFTEKEIINGGSILEEVLEKGIKVITVTESVKNKLSITEDAKGNNINTFENLSEVFTSEYKYKIINYNELTADEKKTYDMKWIAVELCNCQELADRIFISETTKSSIPGKDVLGVWIDGEQKIIIRRDVLSNLEKFLGVLSHELLHAKTGYSDLTREFENSLTNLIGLAIFKYIEVYDEKKLQKNTSKSLKDKIISLIKFK